MDKAERIARALYNMVITRSNLRTGIQYETWENQSDVLRAEYRLYANELIKLGVI